MIPRLEIIFSAQMRNAYWNAVPYEPQSNEFLLNHARSGMLLALRALGCPAGTKVGLMAYNCHTVLNVVYQAGLTPVFVDVTRDLTLDMDDLVRKMDGMRVLIVTHLFGIMNDIQRMRLLYPELIIIEDCAHAFGGHAIYGDFATFSIGQAKLPSIGDGGILVVNNPKYLSAVQNLYPSELAKRSLKRFMYLWIKAILYKPCVYTYFTKPLLKRDCISNPIESIEVRPMDPGIAAILKQQLSYVPEMIVERKRNVEKINKKIPVLSGFNAFMAAIVCDKPSDIAKLFPHTETATHFMHCIDWAKYFGYKEGDCPIAEYLTKHLLVIPTYTYHEHTVF